MTTLDYIAALAAALARNDHRAGGAALAVLERRLSLEAYLDLVGALFGPDRDGAPHGPTAPGLVALEGHETRCQRT